MWWVYIIECCDSTFYTGITTNLDRRFSEHSSKKGAKYFRSRKPVKIVFSYSVADRSSASKLECKIKRMTRKLKENLIAQDKQEAVERILQEN